jgi:REP element-mobilizing transposase RayT
MPTPLAYLITWTTYGTWLPGDDRGWVKANEFLIQPPDPDREADSRQRMGAAPVTLDPPQRERVMATIRKHCEVRGWRLHAVNARSNHVHLVVTADVRPEEVMNQLKAWCSRRLNETTQAAPGGRWWTKHGSTKWINDEPYFANAVRYVLDRQ